MTLNSWMQRCCPPSLSLGFCRLPAAVYLLLAVSLQAMFATAQQAAEQGTAPPAVPNISSDILGVLFLAVGFFFCFFGTSLWRFTLFAAGFIFSFFFTYGLLLNLEGPFAGGNFGPDRSWILLAICLAVGFVGGCIATCLYRIGVFLIGAVGGFFLATLILSLAQSSITSGGGRVAFILAFAIVAGFLSLMVEKHVVIFATAYAGAYLFVYGIDKFVDSGFARAADAALTDIQKGGSLDSAVSLIRDATFAKPSVAYTLLGVMFFLAVSGTVVQYKRYRPFGGRGSKRSAV